MSVSLLCLAVAALLSHSTVVGHLHSVTVLLEYISLQSTECIGGSVGLTNTSVLLQFREVIADAVPWEWTDLFVMNITFEGGHPVSITSSFTVDNSTVQGMQFRLLQLEHGGGGCNCWSLESVIVTLGQELKLLETTQPRENTFCSTIGMEEATFCDLGAGEARGGVTRVLYLPGNNGSRCIGDSNRLLFPMGGPPLPTNCSMETPHLEVSYELHLRPADTTSSTCLGIRGKSESIEFAMRSSVDATWAPLQLHYFASLGQANNTSTEVIRGHPVSVTGSTLSSVTKQVFVCGELLVGAMDVQFRWMSSAYFGDNEGEVNHDLWALSNVTANLVTQNDTVSLFEDSFGSDVLNSCVWLATRRGTVNCTECTGSTACQNHYLTFGAYSDAVSANQIISRIALTQWFSVDGGTSAGGNATRPPGTTESESPTTSTTSSTINITSTTTDVMETTMELSTTSTVTETTPTSTTEVVETSTTDVMETYTTDVMDTTTASTTAVIETSTITDMDTKTTITAPTPVSTLESEIQEMISSNNSLTAITNAGSLDAATLIQNIVLVERDKVEVTLVIYLLSVTLDHFNLTDDESQDHFVELYLVVGSALKEDASIKQEELAIAGSSFLTVMDRLALEVIPASEDKTVVTDNIVLRTQNLSTKGGGGYFTTINSREVLGEVRPELSIQIHSQLVDMFADGSDGGVVRVVSFLYYDVQRLFPRGRPGQNNTELGSGIVSTALQCGTTRCPTDSLRLKTPVRITIVHSDAVRMRLLEYENYTTECVFWKFTSNEDTLHLSSGVWSDTGCKKNDSLSNTSVTVCECTHLTHFAILLSAAPLQLSQPVTLSLQIIGYVGVAISLVAMALTVFTFIAFRSLHNMRNYIHINLCISLGIAQLTFVAGIDQSASDHVPIHCQAVAVLLHYFFLVSFMWMLMEGVVLYVALVRVFVERKKLYLLAFTLTSYGAPLLYLGVLTLPLGFALQPQHYGYNAACFLNPETKFIWAFIAPVIVIIVINTGFFIMAATIMWRHQKKEIDKTHLRKVKKWLRSAVSLVVIMGLTWIFGVLIVEVKGLLALAYIYTILVAFQGVFIFFIFVILSQQVREAYAKWWRVKVNESDTLSRFFGEKTSLSSGVTFTNPTATAASKGSLELEASSKKTSNGGQLNY